HATVDSGIPRESATQRIGINRSFSRAARRDRPGFRHSASSRAFTPVFDGLWTRVNALMAHPGYAYEESDLAPEHAFHLVASIPLRPRLAGLLFFEVRQ